MLEEVNFAPDFERLEGGLNGKGIIQFPDDSSLRREVLPVHVSHPSKNNLYMYRAICEYGAELGYRVFCDPMAGGGSMIYGAYEVMNKGLTYLIELEDEFVRLLEQNLEITNSPDFEIIKGNCIDILPKLPKLVDMMVFSPPYSDQFSANSGKGMNISTYEKGDSGYTGIAEFIKHPDNLSNMKEFKFNLEMDRVFKACYDRLQDDGMLVIITKDRIKNWKKVDYALYQVKQATRAGFMPVLWEQHTHIGAAFGRFNLSKGYRQIELEDIIFMKKRGINSV